MVKYTAVVPAFHSESGRDLAKVGVKIEMRREGSPSPSNGPLWNLVQKNTVVNSETNIFYPVLIVP